MIDTRPHANLVAARFAAAPPSRASQSLSKFRKSALALTALFTSAAAIAAPQTYNDDFKIAAAKLVRQQGYSLKKAALSLGGDPASIREWIRKFDPAPLATSVDSTPEELKREIVRLREENRRLLMEREILKKATAFFAREQS